MEENAEHHIDDIPVVADGDENTGNDKLEENTEHHVNEAVIGGGPGFIAERRGPKNGDQSILAHVFIIPSHGRELVPLEFPKSFIEDQKPDIKLLFTSAIPFILFAL